MYSMLPISCFGPMLKTTDSVGATFDLIVNDPVSALGSRSPSCCGSTASIESSGYKCQPAR
jgi:hypothetical protein